MTTKSLESRVEKLQMRQAKEILDLISGAGGLIWPDGNKVLYLLPDTLRHLVPRIREQKHYLLKLLVSRRRVELSAAEIVESVEAHGGRFLIDENRLSIIPATAAAPVMEGVVRNKAEIIAELVRRLPIPAGVHLVRWTPRPAPFRMWPWGLVTDTDEFIRRALSELDFYLKRGYSLEKTGRLRG